MSVEEIRYTFELQKYNCINEKIIVTQGWNMYGINNQWDDDIC